MVDKLQSTGIGFALMGLWCLFTAFSQVYTGSTEQHFPVMMLCFYTFTLTTIVFFAVNIKNIPRLIKKCADHRRDIGLINITTLGCWVLLIYPLKYIEPSIVGAICIGTSPIVTLLAGKVLYKKQITNRMDYVVSFSLLLTILYLANLCFGSHSAIQAMHDFWQIFFAIICAIASGIVLGFNTLVTKRLSTSQFTPVDILTVRFLLIIFIAGVFQFFSNNSFALTFFNFEEIIIITLSLIIIPQVLFQNSINRIDPISTSIISSLMPVLAFFIEFSDQRLKPNLWTIIGIVSIFIIATAAAIMRYRIEKNNIETRNNQHAKPFYILTRNN